MVKLSKGIHYKIVRTRNDKNCNLSSTVKVGWCCAESKSLALRTEHLETVH